MRWLSRVLGRDKPKHLGFVTTAVPEEELVRRSGVAFAALKSSTARKSSFLSAGAKAKVSSTASIVGCGSEHITATSVTLKV
jgi:hypothetical protein